MRRWIPLLSILLLPHSAAFAQKDRKADCGLEYIAMPPTGPSRGRPPAFILLHGTGGNRGVWAGWARAATDAGMYVFLPLAPGVGTPKSGNIRGDNLKRWDHADHPTLRAFALEMIQKYGCDPKRVYLGGYSNGAWTAGVVGPRNHDIFSAVLIIGGGLAGTPPPEAKDMGFYILHGTADASVPIRNARDAKKKLEKAGFKHVFYKEFPGAGHVLFESQTRHFFEWVKQFRKTIRPGSNTTLPWRPVSALKDLPEDRLALVYLWSKEDRGHPTAENLELEVFTEPDLIQIARKLVCVKIERDREKHDFKKIDGPALLLVDHTGKVLSKWTRPTSARSVVRRIETKLRAFERKRGRLKK